MKRFFVIAVLVVSLAAFLVADVYVKQQTKTPAFMGQPEKLVIQEQWLGKNKIATVSADTTMILDLNTKKVFMIQHQAKTYLEMPLPLDITKVMPDQMATMMKGMMDSMTVTVKANGKTKKVLNWNTTGYDVSMNMMGMDIKMVFWATNNPGFDWKSYSALFTEVYKAQMRVGEKFVTEFKKIDGYPVEMETQVMGISILSSVIEINANKTPGAGVYSVPAGYTKKEKLSAEDLQK